MSNADQKFAELESNVKTLIRKLIDTQEELNMLKKENSELKKRLDSSPETAGLFATRSAANSENLKKKLDQYIAEVEQCIGLVQKI